MPKEKLYVPIPFTGFSFPKSPVESDILELYLTGRDGIVTSHALEMCFSLLDVIFERLGNRKTRWPEAVKLLETYTWKPSLLRDYISHKVSLAADGISNIIEGPAIELKVDISNFDIMRGMESDKPNSDDLWELRELTTIDSPLTIMAAIQLLCLISDDYRNSSSVRYEITRKTCPENTPKYEDLLADIELQASEAERSGLDIWTTYLHGNAHTEIGMYITIVEALSEANALQQLLRPITTPVERESIRQLIIDHADDDWLEGAPE